VTVILPTPNAIDLALALFELKIKQVSVFPAKFKAPSVKVNVLTIERFAPSVKPKVEVFKVTVEAVASPDVVQVPVPELESKVTVSAVVGFNTVGTPPEVIANCVLPVADQVPVPPTQK
jgi:hypothetical protein